MEQIPLVTIVVISYNQGCYIKENLDSIKQLNTLFESIRPKIDPLKIEG